MYHHNSVVLIQNRLYWLLCGFDILETTTIQQSRWQNRHLALIPKSCKRIPWDSQEEKENLFRPNCAHENTRNTRVNFFSWDEIKLFFFIGISPNVTWCKITLVKTDGIQKIYLCIYYRSGKSQSRAFRLPACRLQSDYYQCQHS